MSSVAFVLSLLAVVVFAAHKEKSNDMFTYMVVNSLKMPYFNQSKMFDIVQNKPLVGYMKDAVRQSPDQFNSFQVNFTANGFLVNAINTQYADYNFDGSYWDLSNQTASFNTGVGAYMPHANEIIKLVLKRDTY